jgi:hypothetical protein
MAMRTARRLPGFRFEVQSPPLTEALPRMDVTAFVGFAASGPLHMPVPVEDVSQFTAIYGDDVPLAWDSYGGEQVYGYLAPAVRTFFRNGGRRCWIVRVAGARARSNYFPIPGLAMAEFSETGEMTRITPAFAQARSEGSWSDPLRVSAALLSRPVEALRVLQDGFVADLAPDASKELRAGDLLHVTFDESGYMLILGVKSAELQPAGSPPDRGTRRVTGSRALWFQTSLPTSLPAGVSQARARVFTHELERPSSVPVAEQTLPGSHTSTPDFQSDPIPAMLRWPSKPDQPIELDIALTLAEAPPRGSLVDVKVGTEHLWLTVEDVALAEEQGSPPLQGVRLIGSGVWFVKDAPHPLPVSIAASEILTFELRVQRGNDYTMRLPDLGFAAGHSRFWGDLRTDSEIYKDVETGFEEGRRELAFERERVELGRSKAEPRFPLAGGGVVDALYFPVSMSVLPDRYLGPVKLAGTPLGRDGLAEFQADLFLDTDMLEASTTTLMAQPDFLRYQSPLPRRLRGIHAALSIEEATIIAVPDAVHRGWCPSAAESSPLAEPSSPLARPDWWHFLECDPPPQIPLVADPPWGHFLDCNIRVILAPTLYTREGPDQTGTFTLAWSSGAVGETFTLEESVRPNFGDAVRIYRGPQNHLVLYGRSPGEYYYRVRVEVEGATSDWSNGVGVRVGAVDRWQLKSVEQYSADALLAVQRALLRMCAARGDLLAVLALPEHYREDQAVEHVETLKLPPGTIRGTAGVEALSVGEAAVFSYAAVYHPWLIGREEDRLNNFRRIPPDGAACGILARRALARGAWIAPANEVLRGVVALTPRICNERYLGLQEAQINLVRQEPRGFMALSADTLRTDPDQRPINVRRLLMLLRRLALRLGSRYVFEPNDDSFRRLVQRGFEAMLDDMFVRGAFAGATPATSFQVVTSSALNTPQSVDLGRFIVELRVRPSLPMTFLTIRLVQTDNGAFVTEGR